VCWVAPARMDAISIIKAEMEGKKRQLSELAQAGGRGAEEGGPAPKKKYLTKGQARQLEVPARRCHPADSPAHTVLGGRTSSFNCQGLSGREFCGACTVRC